MAKIHNNLPLFPPLCGLDFAADSAEHCWRCELRRYTKIVDPDRTIP